MRFRQVRLDCLSLRGNFRLGEFPAPGRNLRGYLFLSSVHHFVNPQARVMNSRVCNLCCVKTLIGDPLAGFLAGSRGEKHTQRRSDTQPRHHKTEQRPIA